MKCTLIQAVELCFQRSVRRCIFVESADATSFSYVCDPVEKNSKTLETSVKSIEFLTIIPTFDRNSFH